MTMVEEKAPSTPVVAPKPSAPTIPFRCRLAALLAHKSLQRLWEGTLWLSLAGLGYQNWIPEINGEYRFLGAWLDAHADEDLVIFDVGAHEGDFTDFILKRHRRARVHLFEPNPRPGIRLDRRFSGERRVVINHVAVGEMVGTLPLHDDADQDGTCKASFLREKMDTVRVRTVDVPLITLDDYCRDNGIETVDYLKVDVEGFEPRVFAGARRLIAESRVRAVHFEQNDHALWYNFPLRAIIEVFPHYDIYRLLPGGLIEVSTRRVRYRVQHDFTRIHNLVALRRETGEAINSAYWKQPAAGDV